MKLHLVTLAICLTFSGLWGQEEEKKENKEKKSKDRTVIVEDVMSLEKLETKAEKRAYRRQIWEDTHDKLSKHFNVPPLGWYFNVGGGYGIPFITTPLSSPFDFIGDSDYSQFGKNKKERALLGTNGAGALGTFSFGKMIRPHFGFELEFSLNITPNVLDARQTTETLRATQKTKSYLVGFAPSLVFNTDNISNFYFYGKVGPYIPIGGTAITTANIRDDELALLGYFYAESFETDLLNLAVGPLGDLFTIRSVIKAKAQTTFVPTIGINPSIGVRYQISDNVSIYGEAEVVAFSIRPKTTKFTEFDMELQLSLLGGEFTTVQSKDLDNSPVYLLETEYVKNLDKNSNNAVFNEKGRFGVDLDQPQEQLAFKRNATGFFGKIGVQVDFGRPRISKGKKKSKFYVPGYDDVEYIEKADRKAAKKETEAQQKVEKEAEKAAKKAEKEKKKSDKE